MKSYTDYILGLLLCKGKKTCPNIGEVIDATHDKVYRIIKAASITGWISNLLLLMARQVAKGSDESFLIIDDTALSKRFARFIEGVAYIYDSALGRSERSLSIIVLMWSNGKITIPLGFEFWFTKELVGGERYKKKQTLPEILYEGFTQELGAIFS